MNKFHIYSKAAFFFLLFLGCSKDSMVKTPDKIAPTNLVIEAVVSMDGSGNVKFTATATNASSYNFDFGNGEKKVEPTGIVTYTYTQNGTSAYTVRVTATSSDGLTISKTTDIQITVDQSLAKVTWSDEFNVNGAPDPKKWVYDIGTGSGGWGNAESQYYTDRSQNIVVDNGVLKIKAIKENYSGSTWTSSRIKSLGKFGFTYGRVEVRAKMPVGVGTWPAAWMMGTDIGTVGWPSCGEIDMVEHLGREKDKIYGSLHYPGRSGGNSVTNTKLISNATTEFHIYKLEWTSASIKFYVDDIMFHTVNNSAGIPFNKDFFFLINLAMGGNFGGAIDNALNSATLEVDYIRVYK